MRYLLFLALCSCGYQVSFQVYGLGNGTNTVLNYNADEDRIRILDFERYRAQTRQLYYQFRPDTVIDPSFEQLRTINPVEFRRLCGLVNVKGCDLR
jgi:hypothetical protein